MLLWLITAGWFLAEAYLSHQDGAHTAQTSRTLAESLSFLERDTEKLNIRLRRMAHVALFAGLAFFFALACAGSGAAAWYSVWPVAVWALADEATKPLVHGRHFSWLDVGLNLAGMILGAVPAALLVRLAG